ncbi:CAP domain-containing protein [Shewanella surugensis]|uniref:CAP domain-containing protein n=1 Tax=Shewanella surugensis TaxID=212020 RepID=A0ABT0LJS2_9GAMM|nr:CAP domain-containing protein [Shewanella surugensis]MCL1127371.1 CAP domain-containing protein [Shewanella surugensis]
MRYWLVGIFCAGLISGCNSDDGASSDNQGSDEAVVNDGGSDASSDDDTHYSQISCSDDLTTVLALINEQRTQEQTCGSERYGPVEELTWNALLTAAAQAHSNNMANYDFFSHTGLDESTVATRVTAQGYTWSYVAENIAGGQTTAQSVVDAWMVSDGHCKNIMSENVTEMGLACSANSDVNYHYYWTQVFAKSR